MEEDLKKSGINDNIPRWKRLLLPVLRIIISSIIIYFIFSLVNWRDAVSAYYTAESRFVLYSFLLLFLNIFIRTIRWKIIVSSVKEKVTMGESFGSLMLGISLGSVTPGELGEYAGRALHIGGAKKSYIIGLSLLDKLQIFIVTGAFGLISISLFVVQYAFLNIIIALSVSFISIYILFRIDVLASIGHKLNSSMFKRPLITSVLDGFVLISRKRLLFSFIFTVIFHFVVVLQMFCLINAFSEISFFPAFIATSAMLFSKSLLPFSLSDLGIREAGSIYFFSIVGISNVASLNAALLLFVINVFVPGLIGTYYLWNQRHLTSGLLTKVKHFWNS